MALLLQSLTFGVAVFFILLGIVGVILPILPGMLLIWLTVLAYAFAERASGLAAIDPITFVVLTLIALVTGLSEFWLPLLGAKVRGSARRAIVFGFVGSIIGTFILPLFGTVLGYAVGVLLGEYHKRRDWDQALRAAVGSLAGWGVATALQLGAGILILIIFVWQVIAYQSL